MTDAKPVRSEDLHTAEFRARHLASIAAVRAELSAAVTERIRTERSAPEFQSSRGRGQKLREYAADCIGMRESDVDDVVGFAALLSAAAVTIAMANALIENGFRVSLPATEAVGEIKPVDRSDLLVAIDREVAKTVMLSDGLAMEMRIATFRALRRGTLTISSMRCEFTADGNALVQFGD